MKPSSTKILWHLRNKLFLEDSTVTFPLCQIIDKRVPVSSQAGRRGMVMNFPKHLQTWWPHIHVIRQSVKEWEGPTLHYTWLLSKQCFTQNLELLCVQFQKSFCGKHFQGFKHMQLSTRIVGSILKHLQHSGLQCLSPNRWLGTNRTKQQLARSCHVLRFCASFI